MKIEPSFPDHWKTKRLYRACGPDAVIGLLRLWGSAKIKRQYAGLDLTPARLAALMDYPGDQAALWDAMTNPDGPWLDLNPDGTYTLHGFEEHQRQIIAVWNNGRAGGRPKGIPNSSSNISSSSSSSSSSSPIRLPFANQEKPNGFHSEPNGSPKPKSTETIIPPPLDTPAFREKWESWHEYRRQRKLPKLTPIGAASQLAKLAKWGEPAAIAALDQSISQGWQGVFEPKGVAIPQPTKPLRL
jgi:hypothetical protein